MSEIATFVGNREDFRERLQWCRETYGDPDPFLHRYKHHYRNGEIRQHWYYTMSRPSTRNFNTVQASFHFSTTDMKLVYKLTW
jgi:hypothetical protein